MKRIFSTLSALFSCYVVFATSPITGPVTVCTGNNIILADATPGGTWTSSAPSVASVSSMGVVSGLVSGVATITYDVAGIYVTADITVNPSPAPISGSTSFCNYTSTSTLTCTTPGGIWADHSIHDSISTAGVLYHTGSCGGGCGTDTITYTLSTGCASKFVVTINPLIVVSMPPSICLGSIGMASGTPSAGVWSGVTPFIASISPTGTIITHSTTGVATFTYTLWGCVYTFHTAVSTGIYQHYIINPPATICNEPDFYIEACGPSPSYSVTTYFGDGTSNTTSFAGAAFVHVPHAYTFPGSYTVKQFLYDGATILDSAIFSYEYHFCRTIPIKLYYDNNANSVYDAGDTQPFLSVTIRVDSNGIPIDTISATSGVYNKADGPPGTVYSFRILTHPAGINLTTPFGGVLTETIVPIVNNYPTKYFGFTCGSGAGFDLAIDNAMICGRHMAECNILLSNGYCTPQDAVVKMTFSPKYDFLNAVPAPLSVVGNVITWNIPAIGINPASPPQLKVLLTRPGPWLLPGDTLHSSFVISPTAGDDNTINNYNNRVDTVRSSYDPNDIAVSPQGFIPAATTNLKYTIRFENTGNDTAHNIFVLDTLSDNLDVNSLRMVSASAAMHIYISKTAGLNIVKFDFPNIKLLDSSYHGLCDGIFVYTINTIGGLAPGTIIPNRAGIYFDDNEVVMTNTVNNIIETPSVPPPPPPPPPPPVLDVNNINTALYIALYPNPATDELTIETRPGNYNSYSITNSIGQVLLQHTISDLSTKINVASLPPALYYITFSGINGSTVKKFVKQ